MSDKAAMAEITALMIQKLKEEVSYWQKKALAASENESEEECRESLKKQAEAIDTLVKMAEVAAKQFH